MIEIDGSQGEGGGQIIRSSLALSVVTGQPVRLTKIRAGRKKPGLKKQHVTCVKAAAQICKAEVEGAEFNASEFTFSPGTVQPGDYHFSVGTAGSTTLVAQTVLPALMLGDEPSSVILEGGTHNPWAPPFDFLQQAFLPQLEKAGPRVTANLESYGFYPAGGGRFSLQIEPSSRLTGFNLMDRGGNPQASVRAVVSKLPTHIGERECDVIRRKMNWPQKCFTVEEVEDPKGPGNVVMIYLESPNVTEVVIGIGKQGVKAETVARDVAREAKSHLESEVPVGEYLADQLMMPMGLAASQGQSSSFRTGSLSMHSQTHIDILQAFLDIEIAVEKDSDSNTVAVRFTPASNS